MAKNTIDNFFNDEVANHEWLDAKDKVNAPFSDNLPHEKLPEIAFQSMPSPLHKDFIKIKEANVKKAVDEVKRQLMLGKSLQHVKETVKIPDSILVAAKEELLKVANEYPLLGSVYIEPAAFGETVKSCMAGSAILNQKNSSKLAMFAKKMASCGGCSYNQGGRCRLYKKALVEEVPYTERTFSHYENHLKVANRIASSQSITSREELKQALSTRSSSTREAKSVLFHDQSKRAATQEKYSAFDDKEKRDIAKDLSLKLASGVEPVLFKNYVTTKYASEYKKYPELFSKYAGFVGSLGRVFVELSPFATLSDAKQFIQRHASKVPFVLSDGKKSYTDLDEKFLGRKIISSLSEIPMKYWVSNLSGYEFNAADLKNNPLAVTKKAFLKTGATKVASRESMLEMEQDVEMNGYQPEKVSAKSEVKSQIKQPRQIKSSKPIPADDGFKKAAKVAETVKTEDGKVRVKVDKSLEVEMEGTDFDQSISKYV